MASAAGLLLATGSASAQTIESKRQQAEAIVAEVESMGHELEVTIEAWNYANIQLDEIDSDLASNAKHLEAARKSLVISQQRIQERLRDLYVNGEGDSTLEVILGSQSLDDIIARLDAIERVSSQDTQILRAVKRYRAEVEIRRENLREARGNQARIVAKQAEQKRYIELQIAEQQRMLASVKDEIAEMRAEEARRQAALAEQARARAQASQQAAQATTTTARPARPQAYEPQPASEPQLDSSLPPPRYPQVVGIALQYLGIPYRWGGASPSTGFDCSGLTMYVYAQVGVSLPHNAAMQYAYGTPVSREQLAPGDLVFFRGLGHMGMYIGGGQYVNAPQTGDVVKISSMDRPGYVGARRI